MKNHSFLLLLLGLGLGPVGLMAPSSARTDPQTPLSPIEEEPLVIAVMPFTNPSGQKEHDWLGIGIGEVLTTKLGSLSCFNLVERIKLAEALKEIELGQTGLFDEETAPKVGKIIGAEQLVIGSFQIMGPAIRIDGRFLDVETARVQATAGTTGQLDKIFELQNKIATSFLSALKLPLTDEEKTLLTGKPTNSLEALKLYSQAADTYTPDGKTRVDDQRIILLTQSTQVDPNFALAYASLGDIYANRKLDYRQAEIYYRKVVLLQPHNPASRVWLTRLYLKQGDIRAANQERRKIEEIMKRGLPPRTHNVQKERMRVIHQMRKNLKTQHAPKGGQPSKDRRGESFLLKRGDQLWMQKN